MYSTFFKFNKLGNFFTFSRWVVVSVCGGWCITIPIPCLLRAIETTSLDLLGFLHFREKSGFFYFSYIRAKQLLSILIGHTCLNFLPKCTSQSNRSKNLSLATLREQTWMPRHPHTKTADTASTTAKPRNTVKRRVD